MKLSFIQVADVTLGAVRIAEKDGGIRFFRFTEEQEALYKERSDNFYIKTFSASGVRLQFRTNSRFLFLKAEVSAGSSRSYFAFEVFVNGERTGTLDNFSDRALSGCYSKDSFPLGEFAGTFDLGSGEKNVCIYFPWSVGVLLKELSLDDNSFVSPLRPTKKLLCFGDSITQGYDALYPSNKYTTRLAAALDAEEHNKAIGGEVFFPLLAAAKEAFMPDCITVAYGTNDWNKCGREEFLQNCRDFFKNLVSSYPDARIFAITPIWRKDHTEKRPVGSLEWVRETIKSIAGVYKNVTVISGSDLVDRDEAFYADLRLHPNDAGFKKYYENLSKELSLKNEV